MISFVWSDPLPIYSGRGGTESYTIGHLRELKRRGIPAQVLTYGLGRQDGRQYFPDIKFRELKSLSELEALDDTIVYLNIPHNIPTKHQSYVMFHFPAIEEHGRRVDYQRGIGKSVVMANSRFLRSYWADYLDIEETSIRIVYPFADPAFARVKRPAKSKDITRVLYAGRLSPEKGIYLFLESLHQPVPAHKPLVEQGFSFTVTAAGKETVHGEVIDKLLRRHPWINYVPARHSPQEMAELFAQHDVVVMPSVHTYWHEAFGMVSVEAQHAGCRVVGSNGGGLPETNCGELILFQPANSFALYRAFQKASRLGPLTAAGRREAKKHFTLDASINLFLRNIGHQK